eukprot:197338_1
MAICYRKHFEYNNPWQNQKIQSQSNHWNHDYHHSSFKAAKVSSFDLQDHDKAIKSNNIPIWICSRCTFRNFQRKSLCSMCNLSYKTSQSTSYETKPPIHPPHSNDVTQNIPVWVCRRCTYCNTEQLSHCQICDTPYDQNRQSTNNDISAQQQVIMDSVQCKKSEFEHKHKKKRSRFALDRLLKLQKRTEYQPYQVMPENIINDTPEILAPKLGINMHPKRRKYSKNRLIEVQKHVECRAMPSNIIHQIPQIWSEGKEKRDRRQWSVERLKSMRYDKSCTEMPYKVVSEIAEILSHGLGSNIGVVGVRVRRRKKFTVEKLKSVRFEAGYDVMPLNIMNDEPQILAYGLGIKDEMKS